MGRSIEQMKSLIADANKKINEIEAQRDKAVEYKLSLLQQFTEVIGETTVAPSDPNQDVIIEPTGADINSDSLIGYTGHGLIDKPTKEDIFRNAETDEDGNLIVERDMETIEAVNNEKIMAVAAAEAAKVAEARARTLTDHTDEEVPNIDDAVGLNNEETGKPEGVE